MKIPLHYQYTEYDCGPTSVLNAISYLFEREEIPPEIVQNIFLFCLDCCGSEGLHGRGGTSRSAMMNLSQWLCEYGNHSSFGIECSYLSGKDVFLGDESEITRAVQSGAAVVLRLYFEPWHYVLMTGQKDGLVELFDPYYEQEEELEEGVIMDNDHPFSYNRIVPTEFFNRECEKFYALGDYSVREAVILRRTKKK